MVTMLGHPGYLNHLGCLSNTNPQVISATPVPSHRGQPSSKATPVPIPAHSDVDGVLVGRHVEDQLGCAITLGGDETLEAISLDGDTWSWGLIGVSDVDLQGMRCDMRTLHGDMSLKTCHLVPSR